jgi:uncharacterized membrane protein YozB (DUF420 family)
VDAGLLYWTGAFANMLVVAGLAVHGLRCARRREFRRHARAMRGAALLVGLFLLSYVVKGALLGREARGRWSPQALGTLRFHELCVLAMLIAGAIALALGARLRRTRLVTAAPGDPPAGGSLRRRHRLAGRVALASVLLGAASAGLVLAGMYARAGWLDAPLLALAGTEVR